MQVIVENALTTITDPTQDVTDFIKSTFKCTDKAKQYQLKRMSRNVWQRTSPLFKQIQQEVDIVLYEELPGGHLQFSSSLYELFRKEFTTLITTDNRVETGITVALPWVKKPFDLRDYQEEAVDLMMTNWRGIINFATGLGKTLVATHLVKRCRKRALIVCPSESVAKQFYNELVSAVGANKVGFYGDGKKKINDITVGIAASISKNVEEFKKHDIGLIIVDEVHHVPATTFYTIAAGLGGTGKIFGLTATDFRADGKDIMISAGCGDVLIRRDIKWGVANKWLAEPYFIIRRVATTGQDYPGDKLKSYKEHVLNNTLMCDQILDDCRKMMAAGKSILCLVDEVEHGKRLSEALGIPFATGNDSASGRYVDDLNSGKIPGLVGTDSKIGEGTDTKNVDALIMANFAAGKGPVTQALGRGLRMQGTKTRCLILDYIPLGSTMMTRHGWGRVKFYKDITDKIKVI